MSEPVLRTERLGRTYRMGRIEVPVLKGIDLSIGKGTFTLIVGHSGCGKSTLLHVLSLLDAPTEGRVLYDGQDAFAESSAWRQRVRNRRIGFVFQFYHLLPELTVLGNVMLPELIGHGPLAWLGVRRDARERAARMLDTVGLNDRMDFKPSRLSGGERQRAAAEVGQHPLLEQPLRGRARRPRRRGRDARRGDRGHRRAAAHPTGPAADAP